MQAVLQLNNNLNHCVGKYELKGEASTFMQIGVNGK